jgi:N-acetylmuramoyl-L-alanine amidase
MRFLTLIWVLSFMKSGDFHQFDRGKILINKIVIDAGHGGKDPGCSGKFVKEKDVALDIALALGKMLSQYLDVQVIYTRTSPDQFVELKERSMIANRAQAQLFVSIHCNSSPSKTICGSETYFMGMAASEANMAVSMRENASIFHESGFEEKYQGLDPNSPQTYILLSNMQTYNIENSLKLASMIEARLGKNTCKSRGVKQAGFFVLARTFMPSVLVETGFLSNPDDEAILMSEAGRAQIAASIYRAIRDYKREAESSNN